MFSRMKTSYYRSIVTVLILLGCITIGYIYYFRAVTAPTSRSVIPPSSALVKELHDDSSATGNKVGMPTRPGNTTNANHNIAPDSRVLRFMASQLDEIPNLTYEVSNLGAQFEYLAAAAAGGDIKAIRTLYRALKACPATLPRDPVELQRVQDSIDSGTRSEYLGPRESPETGHARLAALRSRCGFVSPLAYERMYDYLIVLADAGDSGARLDFPFRDEYIDWRSPDATRQRQEHASRSLNYLELELAAGNLDALAAISRTFRDGQIRPRDSILAYAYLYAATLGPGEHRVRMDTLQGMRSRMTPEQLEQATTQALQIFSTCFKQ